MSDFVAPSGPPPPRVPEGWKAVWNQQYQEWFFVNTYTKESTWEKPTAPAGGNDTDLPPGAPPPSYNAGPNAPSINDTKKTPLESNNPYSQVTGARETDEEMARRLQREEEQQHRGGVSPLPGSDDRGLSDSYYQNSSNSQQYPVSPGQSSYPGGSSGAYPQQTSTDAKRGSGGGFLGKLKDKFSGSQGSSGYPARPSGYGQPGYGQQYQQQPGYGQHYQQPGYGQYQQQPMYAQQPMYGQQPPRRSGMGVGGAAALGVGGGLLGGMLLGEAMDGGDGGGDYGGGDDGGGGGDF